MSLFDALKIFDRHVRLAAESEENFGQDLADLIEVSHTVFLQLYKGVQLQVITDVWYDI